MFKVETVGDCYGECNSLMMPSCQRIQMIDLNSPPFTYLGTSVAVTGLPEARKDHAVLMARFARDCLVKMTQVVQRLELLLGPDTAELAMRFGLHSGPVTAGVLRGEKSRFQLFGDTVNTAARMESLGVKNRIHCSQATADELILRGHGNWLVPRKGTVKAKGKGEMQTYFLDGLLMGTTKTASIDSSDEPFFDIDDDDLEDDDDDDDYMDDNADVTTPALSSTSLNDEEEDNDDSDENGGVLVSEKF